MRMLALVALVLVSTATSCITSTGIAISPIPALDSSSVVERTFALVQRVGVRRGMQPYTAPDEREEGWMRCFAQELTQNRKLQLCGKLKDHQVHLRLSEIMASRFSPHADSVRAELLDSLRAEFGAPALRECEWRYEYDSRRSGCSLSAQPDSAETAPSSRKEE